MKKAKKDEKGPALRFNEGKPLMHLIPVQPLLDIAKVFTYGANKYAKRNWELGAKWSIPYDSLYRHLLAWLNGEDYDESGCLHMAHVAVNAMFLLEYSRTCPELDDRPKKALEELKNLIKKGLEGYGTRRSGKDRRKQTGSKRKSISKGNNRNIPKAKPAKSISRRSTD
jgi:hypothetical protein